MGVRWSVKRKGWVFILPGFARIALAFSFRVMYIHTVSKYSWVEKRFRIIFDKHVETLLTACSDMNTAQVNCRLGIRTALVENI
jgi:hypothetical protein